MLSRANISMATSILGRGSFRFTNMWGSRQPSAREVRERLDVYLGLSCRATFGYRTTDLQGKRLPGSDHAGIARQSTRNL